MKLIAKPYSQPTETVLHSLQVDLAEGLSDARVQSSREKFGTNVLPKPSSFSILRQLINQLTNPLVLILLVALIITLFLQREVDSIVIFLALVINAVISLYQEDKAQDIFNKLAETQTKFAHVIRKGKDERIPTEQVVVGDVVKLQAGSTVPADLRLCLTNELQIDESALTGEWKSVNKSAHFVSEQNTLAEQSSMAFAGTLVVSGEATGVVVAVGRNTEFGAIAADIEGIVSTTPLQKEMRRLANFISIIALVVTVLIFSVGLLKGVSTVDMLIVAIALAVSAVPEGLPAAVTVVLAVGMERVLRQGGLVKNLLAAETLGSTTVIITDKTGTLTEGKMKVVELAPAANILNPKKDINLLEKRILEAAVLTSDGYITYNNGKPTIEGRPVEKAVIERALSVGVRRDSVQKTWQQLDFLPFSSEQRFAASLNRKDDSRYVFFCGAPEYLLSHAEAFLDHNNCPLGLNEKAKADLGAWSNKQAAMGRRLIAVAEVYTQKSHFGEVKAEDLLSGSGHKLIFMGYIVLSDPVRDDVPESIKLAQAAGCRVIMATGDNALTAKAIAIEAGIATSEDDVVEGRELAELTDEKLYERAMRTNIFARVKPSQKSHLARVLQTHGQVVAMTGDGINDAPALTQADIGVAVNSGTDVAKAASDLILMQNSFSVIVAAIKEGRRIIDNLKKVLVHLISGSFSEIVLILGAIVFGLSLPILPPQILWVNIVQGGLLTFAFAFEPAEAKIMQRTSQRLNQQFIFDREIKNFLVALSFTAGLFIFSLYYLLIQYSDWSIDLIRTLMVIALSLDALVFAFSLKNLHEPLWRISLTSNKALLWAVTLSLSALTASLFIAPLRDLLSLTVPHVPALIVVGITVGFDLLVIEVYKRVFFKQID
jgi:Ca2+-transporting ATPase